MPPRTTALGLHVRSSIVAREASGIVTFDGRLFHNHRAAGLVGDIFGAQSIMAKLVGYSAIGHNRYATTGGSSDRNIQPIFADFDFMAAWRWPIMATSTQRIPAAQGTGPHRLSVPVDHRHRGHQPSDRPVQLTDGAGPADRRAGPGQGALPTPCCC